MFRTKIYDIIKCINPECYKLPFSNVDFQEKYYSRSIKKRQSFLLEIEQFFKIQKPQKKAIDLSIATDLRWNLHFYVTPFFK